MQHSPSQVTRPQLIHLYAANLACAFIVGLTVAAPITGATFMVALGASCMSEAGCSVPTFVDQLVPVVGVIAWALTAVNVGVLQIRTLRRTVSVRPALTLPIR